MKKASIIIPNRNDSVMLGVTIRTVLENIRNIDGDIILADNSDEDIYNIITKRADKTGRVITPIPLAYSHQEPKQLKIIHLDKPSMYAARQKAVDISESEYIMNSDSHCVWGANIVKTCINFMDSHPDAGICGGPISWINRPDTMMQTHIQENKNGGIFGPWKKSKILPIKIPWSFGFRIARKDWFEQIRGYSFFADKSVSWGGGEFYLCMKSWLLGRPNWCIDCNPVYHIGPYSKEVESLGYRYRVYGSSGNGRQGIGILAAFFALGGDEAKEECQKSAEGLRAQYGIDIDRDWLEARKIAEEDREWILKNQVISFKELLEEKPWNK